MAFLGSGLATYSLALTNAFSSGRTDLHEQSVHIAWRRRTVTRELGRRYRWGLFLEEMAGSISVSKGAMQLAKEAPSHGRGRVMPSVCLPVLVHKKSELQFVGTGIAHS